MADCSSYGLDCQGIQDLGFTKSGVYHVTPTGFHDGFDAYCDMETDSGGWLVSRIRGTSSQIMQMVSEYYIYKYLTMVYILCHRYSKYKCI